MKCRQIVSVLVLPLIKTAPELASDAVANLCKIYRRQNIFDRHWFKSHWHILALHSWYYVTINYRAVLSYAFNNSNGLPEICIMLQNVVVHSRWICAERMFQGCWNNGRAGGGSKWDEGKENLKKNVTNYACFCSAGMLT